VASVVVLIGGKHRAANTGGGNVLLVLTPQRARWRCSECLDAVKRGCVDAEQAPAGTCEDLPPLPAAAPD
jgi:hypothetical protein